MSLVFQYGSNTNTQRINSAERLNGGATVVGIAQTKEKFDLDFTVWSNGNGCAAADIVPNGSTRIWGVLYEIPDTLIYRNLAGDNNSLDAIENEGQSYKRIKIEVIFNEENLTVLSYVVIEKKQNLKTCATYASEIIKGLKSHEVPQDYQEYVYNRILLNNALALA